MLQQHGAVWGKNVEISVQTCHLELSHIQYECAASALQLFVEFGRMPNLRYPPKKKVEWHQIWWIRRPCLATSCMHVVIQGNYLLTKIFVQELKCCRLSLWMSTIMHEPRGIQIVLQSSMNPHKFFQNPKVIAANSSIFGRRFLIFTVIFRFLIF